MTVVQANWKRSRFFAIEWSVRPGCLSRLFWFCVRPYSIDGFVVKVYAYVIDVTVFVSHRGDFEAVKQVMILRYEKVSAAKINLNKGEGIQLGAFRGLFPFLGPFRWSDGLIRVLGMWFVTYLLLDRYWSSVEVKIDVEMRNWTRRRLSLKGRT